MQNISNVITQVSTNFSSSSVDNSNFLVWPLVDLMIIGSLGALALCAYAAYTSKTCGKLCGSLKKSCYSISSCCSLLFSRQDNESAPIISADSALSNSQYFNVNS